MPVVTMLCDKTVVFQGVPAAIRQRLEEKYACTRIKCCTLTFTAAVRWKALYEHFDTHVSEPEPAPVHQDDLQQPDLIGHPSGVLGGLRKKAPRKSTRRKGSTDEA